MPATFPYMSGSGALLQIITHLRNSFPSQITAETLKKLGIAPNNESYVINILRFTGVIDEDGKKTSEAGTVFTKHEDEEFRKEFSSLIEQAYSGLFELHGDSAWSLPTDKLISFFRSTDQTSAIVGQRQAGVFQTLAGISGHGDPSQAKSGAAKTPKPKNAATKPKAISKAASTAAKNASKKEEHTPQSKQREFGLSVRIEINLPAVSDQGVYDKIFKSMRENLLNG